MSYYPYISTQKQLRDEFWAQNPLLIRRGRTKQNQYPSDTRTAWCDFVEYSRRNGDISQTLAQKATL